MSLLRKPALAGLSLFVLSLSAGSQTPARAAGLEALRLRLPAGELPTGAGVLVGQVEQSVGGSYAPDASDPELVGTLILLQSGPSPLAIPHATSVGRFFYGSLQSLAPGLSPVHVFSVPDFAGTGVLHWPGGALPADPGLDVLNNSWNSNQGAASNELLRRMDWATDTYGILVCNTVGNGPGPLPSPVMSHAFNALTVGRSDGLHTNGLTGFGVDGPGRMKPEIVAPGPFTSFATPLVAGAAALLIETARSFPTLRHVPEAVRPEVLKAVLLAGAEHRAGWDNGAPASGASRGATATPLDPLWGADELDVDRAHWILTGGREAPAASTATAPTALHRGWSYASTTSGGSLWLRFEVERAQELVSIVATWNRHVDPGLGSWSLPNLGLELWADTGGSPTLLVGNPGLGVFASGNVRSSSAVDNVEHLYLRDLAPGAYFLQLRRTADALGPWDVAVAWELRASRPRFQQGAPPALNVFGK